MAPVPSIVVSSSRITVVVESDDAGPILDRMQVDSAEVKSSELALGFEGS